MTVAPRTLELTVLHGDTWDDCPWFAVAIGGAAPDLTHWDIRAQVRDGSSAPLFSWHAALGNTTDTGLEIATARVRLRDGSELDLPAIQPRLYPRDWVGIPTRWSGFLEVELTRGPADSPVDRRTIVRRRPLRIVPDLVP